VRDEESTKKEDKDSLANSCQAALEKREEKTEGGEEGEKKHRERIAESRGPLRSE